jgi:hypothetical protein
MDGQAEGKVRLGLPQQNTFGESFNGKLLNA